jgi:hypothetical protein
VPFIPPDPRHLIDRNDPLMGRLASSAYSAQGPVTIRSTEFPQSL